MDLPKHIDVSDILKNLVRFKSTPGNENECIQYIKTLLTSYKFHCDIYAKEPQKPNLITRLEGKSNNSPLLLYGHIDVVPVNETLWSVPPFEGVEKNGSIWGRGTLDMKGGVAMMIYSIIRARIENIQPPQDIIFLALSDEESRSEFGAQFITDKHADLFQNIKYAIGEFGGFTRYIGKQKFYLIQVAEKKACWIQIKIKGKGGHGSIPIKNGAVSKLATILTQLNKRNFPIHIVPIVKKMFLELSKELPFFLSLLYRLFTFKLGLKFLFFILGDRLKYLKPLFTNTASATVIDSGHKINVIPSEITLKIDGRILPGFHMDDYLKELKKIIGKKYELEILKTDEMESYQNMDLMPLINKVTKLNDPQGRAVPMVLSASTDAQYFSRLGIQTYGFLPMNLPKGFNFSDYIHAPNERIPISTLNFGAQTLFDLIQNYGIKD